MDKEHAEESARLGARFGELREEYEGLVATLPRVWLVLNTHVHLVASVHATRESAETVCRPNQMVVDFPLLDESVLPARRAVDSALADYINFDLNDADEDEEV